VACAHIANRMTEAAARRRGGALHPRLIRAC
jgi:hypothetical protein